MSEGNVSPRSHDATSLGAAQGQLPLDSAHPPAADDDWETVPFVGMPPLSVPNSDVSSPSQRATISIKEAELQSRIVDLNQCNEVLLSRVHQLEDALERSQQALQQEVERSQQALQQEVERSQRIVTTEDKIAAAQTRSVAQLLSELDEANAALKRQTVLAETLTAQLKSAEERAERLEKECAILRKRKSERAKQLQAAEETCADLRSRLQRQQQYTLQFKTALEKCLDTSAFQHTSHTIEQDLGAGPEAVNGAAIAPASPIGMPRSESIRPWSANPAQLPTDHQLQSLIRSQPPSPTEHPAADPGAAVPPSLSTPPSPPSTAPTPPAASAPAAPEAETPPPDSEAQQQLWQDVERVMENAAQSVAPEPVATEDEPKTHSQPAAPSPMAPPDPTTLETAEFTEPIPWGAPIKSEAPAIAPAPPPAKAPEPVAAAAHPASPPPAPAVPDAPQVPAYAASIPALHATPTPQKSPSPLVHPLRPPQRKRKSLSAVELPSFPPLPKVYHE